MGGYLPFTETGYDPIMIPAEHNTIADRFVLLFSADWFKPYWKITGFWPKPGLAEACQLRMRALVERLVDGASTYWEIDFTADRIHSTRADFITLITDLRDPASDVEYIDALTNREDVREAITKVSMAHWSDYETTVHDVDRVKLTETEWDRYLANLTPDLPSYLRDFAVSLLRGEAR
jgi:hypothetical protein